MARLAFRTTRSTVDDIPTLDEMQELSARGWGTSWAVVGSSLLTMVEGSGADRDWVQLSDEGARLRQQRAARDANRLAQIERRRLQHEAQRAADRQAFCEAERRRREAFERMERLREARYEEEARKTAHTLREYRRTHPFGVEAYGPAGPAGEAIWYPIEMRLGSADEAEALAETLHRIQGLVVRAVHW